MDRKQITVVGSYNVGLFLKGKDIPTPGQTLMGDTFTEGGGGKGSNQAVAAAKLGADTYFVGCIGTDNYGKNALKMYEEQKISAKYIRRDESIHTGISVIFIDEQGNNSIMVIPGANYHLSREDIDAAVPAMEKSMRVGFQLENSLDVVSYGLRKAYAAGAVTLLDPAPAQPLPDELYPYISILKPNEHEAAILSGIPVTDAESAEKAGKWFLEKGVRTVIITLGSKGAVLVEKERQVFFPSMQVEAVDTTGAGDCFSGALMAGLSQGMELEDAIRFAHKAAAISTTRLGVIEALPSQEQIKELWGEL